MKKNEELLKLGHKIRYERKKHELSQLDLSLKAGLTTRTISRIECGEIDPKYLTLVHISNALEISIIDLLNFTL